MYRNVLIVSLKKILLYTIMICVICSYRVLRHQPSIRPSRISLVPPRPFITLNISWLLNISAFACFFVCFSVCVDTMCCVLPCATTAGYNQNFMSNEKYTGYDANSVRQACSYVRAKKGLKPALISNALMIMKRRCLLANTVHQAIVCTN